MITVGHFKPRYKSASLEYPHKGVLSTAYKCGDTPLRRFHPLLSTPRATAFLEGFPSGQDDKNLHSTKAPAWRFHQ